MKFPHYWTACLPERSRQISAESYGWTDEQEVRLKLFLLRHRDNIQDLVKVADRYISHAAEVFGCLLLIPVLAIFFCAMEITSRMPLQG